MEDCAIISLFWARDEQAIPATDEKYGGACRTLASRLLDSWEDGEECVNDTWHRAWNTMPPQRPESLKAYLLKIVRNLSIDRWREQTAQKRGGGLTRLSQELEECLPTVPSAEAETEGRLVSQCIDRWLVTLSKEDRTAFLRRYWYGWQVSDIAKAAGYAPNRMSQRLRRLRSGLKQALEQEGIVL
jgi:RNA polymerase sigma-70 factor (ECF subfamily)